MAPHMNPPTPVVTTPGSNDETDANRQPPIPVDRDWIAKLLKKYPNPNSRRHDKALVVAPMVDQSDLPFRLLCRNYGANLCFTPMIHARMLMESDRYRQQFIGTWLQQDRPLIAQMCGGDPEYVLQAAKFVEPYVDGIDINCGCPQNIAKRGNYGAYLLEQEDMLLTLVKHLVKHLHVPLSVKVRLLPPVVSTTEEEDPTYDIPQASLNLYTKLVDAGVHLLTIHGRTRHEKGMMIRRADWETIGKAVQLLGDRIPIFANGGIETYDDVDECLRITNADGIMSSESLLEYPPIFYNIPQVPTRTIGRLQLTQEYLSLARQYPPNVGGQGSGLKCMRTHAHRFLHADLQDDIQVRQELITVDTLEELQEAVDKLEKVQEEQGHDVQQESLSWYLRHRLEPEAAKERFERNKEVARHELQDDTAECFCSLFGDDEE